MTDEIASLLQTAQQAFQKGDPHQARSLLAKALSLDPNEPNTNLVCGIVAAQLGDFQEAAPRFQHVLSIDPIQIDALNGLAYALLSVGRAGEALTFAQRALTQRPQDPGILNTVGLCLDRSGSPAEALSAFDAALKSQPQAAVLHKNRGQALEHLHRTDDAIAAFRMASRLEPRDPEPPVSAAGLILSNGDPLGAIREAERALSIQPNWSAAVIAGRAFAQLRNGPGAEKYLQQAAAWDPRGSIPYSIWLIEEGRLEEAVATLEGFLKDNPRNGPARYWLTEALNLKDPESPLITEMTKVADDPNTLTFDRLLTNFAIGRSLDRGRSFDAAAMRLDRANEEACQFYYQGRPLKGNPFKDHADGAILHFGKTQLNELKRGGNPSSKPIFVVGMIRSGTTLVEQILSSHPDITGGGELRFWMVNGSKAMVERKGYPQLAEKYLEILDAIDPESKYVTDKSPLNYEFLGAIHAIFPNAKIIHLKRHPIDTCLSMGMMVHHGRPPEFAYSKERAVKFYLQYLRLMEHWHSVLPASAIYQTSYEDLVENREEATRKLLEFLELPWNEACLSPEKNRSSVRTPSLMQVRQPVYRSSLERWKNYEPWLGELAQLKGLGGY